MNFFYLGPDGKIHTIMSQYFKYDHPLNYKILKYTLWAILWIAVFPLPATILLRKTEKMKKSAATTAAVALWILYGLFITFGILLKIFQ